jgi:hypothetical protein
MGTKLNYVSANAGANGTTYYNLVRDSSIVESKNHEHTDRNGHVKGYLINYEILATDGQILNFTSAPNTWKMRNAFRKWHAYRNEMFMNAGIVESEKGRYGHTIRPYLDNNHRLEEAKTSGTIDIGTLYGFNPNSDPTVTRAMTGGEWTYSQLATVPLYEFEGPTMKTSTLKVADEWPVMVLGENVAGSAESDTSGQYVSVGMIHSYNLDRMEVVTPTADSTISGPANPLAALKASGNQAAGEILEISKDQELELPPYDLADAGDSVFAVTQTLTKTPTTLGVVRGSCFVPAGLLAVYQSANAAYQLHIDVVAEVLCKDMA